jgi:hypothetical protein
MKQIETPAADEIHGGTAPPLQELPLVEPLPVKGPGIEVDYNPTREQR